MQLPALKLTPAAFAPFGQILDLVAGGGDALVRTDGPGWQDCYTRAPLIGTNGSLGLTRSGGMPFDLHQMERHPNTQEALFCLDAPIVLAVAPAGAQPQPEIADIRAFVIPKGVAVVLEAGTWHDGCRGLDGPVAYYWMATVGTGTEWRDVAGGPVTIERGPQP